MKLARDGSASDAHLKVDATATALVAVGATGGTTDGGTAAGAPARLVGVSHRSQPQHRCHHQQPCFVPHPTVTLTVELSQAYLLHRPVMLHPLSIAKKPKIFILNVWNGVSTENVNKNYGKSDQYQP